MSCSNCYNNCTEIVSDRCVRYTGIDVPVLGVKNGDSLSFVEQALIEFLTSTINGTGIKPIIEPTIICDLVKNYLPTCGDLTVNDIFTALIKAACDLQDQVDAIVANVETIEAPYETYCLTDVTTTSGTHDILQAVVIKLCSVAADLESLTRDLTLYALIANMDIYISNYLAQHPTGSAIRDKMVPNTVVEYYGSLNNFDDTGAGLDSTGVGGQDWTRVFICNGLNGTPDKRGRVGVGAIVGVPGPKKLDPAIDPNIPESLNPNYAIYDKVGSNSIILTPQQMPLHTHVPNVTQSTATEANGLLVDPGHSHVVGNTPEGWSGSGSIGIVNREPKNVTTSVSKTGISVKTDIGVSIGNSGSDFPHANNQPALACYYIMYIP
jgi:microcystin-dependent protein